MSDVCVWAPLDGGAVPGWMCVANKEQCDSVSASQIGVDLSYKLGRADKPWCGGGTWAVCLACVGCGLWAVGCGMWARVGVCVWSAPVNLAFSYFFFLPRVRAKLRYGTVRYVIGSRRTLLSALVAF